LPEHLHADTVQVMTRAPLWSAMDQHGRYPDHEYLVPGEGDFDYARYLAAMDTAGYSGCVTVEISVMVQ
jgi:sugar phosphate isomerase/epimerase